MQNKYDLNISTKSPYENKSNTSEKLKQNLINEIPNNVNKVKKLVIRGVIKHDSSSNQQS